MSVSQTNMSNIQKVQQKPTNASKDNSASGLDAGFNSLFAQAMQGRGMGQQLASSELDLQKDIGKNEHTPATPPADLSGLNGVASAVHSAIYAQRNANTSATSNQGLGGQVSAAAKSANATQANGQETSNKEAANQPASDSKPSQSAQTSSAKAPEQAKAPDGEATSANSAESTTPNDRGASTLATTAAANNGQSQAGNNVASVGNAQSQGFTTQLASQTADGKALDNEITTLDSAAEAAIDAQMQAADKTSQPKEGQPAQTRNIDTDRTLSTLDADNTKANAKSDTLAETSTITKGDPASDTKVDAKAESRVELKPDAKVDHRIQDRPQLNARADMAAAMMDTRAQQAATNGKLQAGDVKLTTTAVGASQATDGQPGIIGLAGVANGKQAGQATEALIKTPITQPGFAKELGQKLTWAIGKNLSTVDLRVNPEQFGSMNIRLMQKGDQVQLVIRTADDAASTLLTQAVAGLKEAMGQQGLQLTNVQIQTGQPQQGSNPQFGQQANQGQQGGNSQNQGQQQSGGSSSGNRGGEDAQANATQPARRNPNGNLDLFA